MAWRVKTAHYSHGVLIMAAKVGTFAEFVSQIKGEKNQIARRKLK